MTTTDVRAILREALDRKVPVMITYLDDQRQIQEHEIEPHLLRDEVVFGYCHVARCERSFRLARILAARLTDRW